MTDARFVTWREGDKVLVVGVLEGAAAAAVRCDRRRLCAVSDTAGVSIACALDAYATPPPDWFDRTRPDQLLADLAAPTPQTPPTPLLLSSILHKALRRLADGEPHYSGPVTTDTLVSGKPALRLVEMGYATKTGSLPAKFTITEAGRRGLALQPTKRSRP